jgi:sarcosine oxidase subunit gamma
MHDLRAARSPPSVTASRVLQALPPAVRYLLRGGAAARAAAEAAFGVAIPCAACRAASNGERAALWLGPQEWLLLAPEAHSAAVATALGATLATVPHSLVDVSHAQSALSVSGPEAAMLLAAGCPLDLDATAFPVGMCTRTVLAKAEVVLWRTAGESFRIEVSRSFVAYVSQFLAEAARGLV